MKILIYILAFLSLMSESSTTTQHTIRIQYWYINQLINK